VHGFTMKHRFQSPRFFVSVLIDGMWWLCIFQAVEADEVITAICMKRRLVFERMYFFMCADAMEETRCN
jgi:hypothetical protein